jgi:1-acyl-sn-glycerol-3-phosphate acyltransferase
MLYDIDSLDNRDPKWIERFVRWVGPALHKYFRPVVRGLERIPAGRGLMVANHNGGTTSADTFVFGSALYEHGGLEALPFGLGHEVILRVPGLHQILMPLGVVRASHDNARRLFAAGHKVLVYPGGDLESVRPFRERHRIVFGPRRGYIRLALRENVAIIPVVTAGAHSTFIVLNDGRWLARKLRLDRWLRLKTWPISLSIPWGLTVGFTPPHFPLRTQIYIDVLEPISFERSGDIAATDDDYVECCHRRVTFAMQAAMDRLVAERATSRPP